MRHLGFAILSLGLLAACETTGGYGGGYGGGGTQLSQCMRNALIGAGVGAVLGGVTGAEGRKTEGAVLGGAVIGAGTFALCKVLNSSEQARIERSYLNALNANGPVSDGWVSATGQRHVLQVTQPRATDVASCRLLDASLAIGDGAPVSLPTERYCRTNAGTWMAQI